MDLLPVEIKVDIEGDATGAMSALGASQRLLTTRRIWFAEDRDGVARGAVPLLDSGVIVRFRTGGGPDELVVKLRPCTRDQLVGRFSAAFDAEPLTYKIEGDWTRNGRVLAASLAHRHPPGTLAAVLGPGADPAGPIDPVQDQFLHACKPDVPLDGLVALGPILSTKADDVPLGDLEVDLEDWSVAGLRFLEASLRVKPKDGDDAEEFDERVGRRLDRLEAELLDRGLTPSPLPAGKTHRVLTALTAAAHG